MQMGEPSTLSEALSWVAISLTNDDGKPAAMELYRIELPDGSVVEGRLNVKGYAVHRGIKEGTCKISFPNLDAGSWKPA